MILTSVYGNTAAPEVLYRLLQERTPEQSISHKAMPTWEQHLAFVNAVPHPYPHWYLLQEKGEFVGSIYLTERREVGLCVFDGARGQGYGRVAMALLEAMHPGPMLANIAPGNPRSHRFFQLHGFELVQMTYRREP